MGYFAELVRWLVVSLKPMVTLLNRGSLPLDISIREQTDSGKLTIVTYPYSNIAKIYKKIVHRIANKVADMAQNHSAIFPNIVVQNA